MTGPTQFDPTIGGSAPVGVSPPDPPSAPQFERRVKFRRSQLFGVLALTLLPIIEAFGLLGPFARSTSGSSESVDMRVEYPAVQRYTVLMPLRVHLTNTGEETLGPIEVALGSDYLAAFKGVTPTPEPSRITDDVYVFVLEDVGAGDTRLITLELQAEDFGRHAGQLEWRLLDGAGAAVDEGTLQFMTVILP